MSQNWATAADVEARLRRRWSNGTLLRAYAAGEPFEPLSVSLRGPVVADLAQRLDSVRRWAAALERAAENGRNFTLEPKTLGGGRHLIGTTEVPGRAHLESYSQAWRMLGVGGIDGEVARFDRVLRESGKLPVAHEWVLANPLRAIQLANEWPAILAAREWLDWNRGSGLYLRQVDTPGVDTKLIERHSAVLASLLDLPRNESVGLNGFARSLGLAAKPNTVRLRFDPALLGMPAGVTEAVFRVDELSVLSVQPEQALIVENEISYLSVPVQPGGVVLWGKGYDVNQSASLSWLKSADNAGRVRYWGDIDTHGFQILHRVRNHLPKARSVMMDRETLLAHETRWGSEPKPTNAALAGLTVAEHAMYTDLVTGRYAPNLRLEQERIDWAWVMNRM